MSFAYHRIEKFSFASLLMTMTCDENWVRFAISGIWPPAFAKASVGKLMNKDSAWYDWK